MPETYTTAEVQKHKDEANGFWLIVENDVYDVTSTMQRPPDLESHSMLIHTAEFIDEHPGGSKILKRWSGKNATKAFWKYHSEDVLKKYGKDLKIGAVGESAKL
ncbi:hypothetical protein KAF25_004611 [Fusarium avenaceum]|uniref:Cytochrome b5 heme-binding domain-containing protein n=1 Tax=Fusarium avenaceum TaxID=40199 RepID=A0A9P7GZN1_9HYPO|nr:hypothetical protein KAF25_004611 [Fusarium avenaceum]